MTTEQALIIFAEVQARCLLTEKERNDCYVALQTLKQATAPKEEPKVE